MSKRILKQLIAMGLFCSCVCADAEAFKVSIIKVVEHEAINAVVEGIKDELKGRGVKYDIETCQADPALAYQIATKFVNDKIKCKNTDKKSAISEKIRNFASEL